MELNALESLSAQRQMLTEDVLMDMMDLAFNQLLH
jgi:hypothetical protein